MLTVVYRDAGDGSVTATADEHPGPEGRLKRLAAVLGREFEDNALLIDLEREGVRLSGYAGLPMGPFSSNLYLFIDQAG